MINVFGDAELDVWTEVFGEVWYGDVAAYTGSAPCRTVTVAAENRVWTVEAETRTIIVSAENRIVEVSCP